jgi:hypothetical protein
MIIARLRGGLGNQLFQYAAGRALAAHHGVELKLDLYTYTKHPYRKFELDTFNIDAVEATRDEVHQFTGSNPIVRYLNKRNNYFHCPRVFAQPHYHYYEDFFALPKEIYLSGYWQSEKYFDGIGGLIREQFTPRSPLDSRNSELRKRMEFQHSVAVHVRRGDYSSASYASFFGGLPETYYVEAMSMVKERVGNPVFYFFSDDIAWCKSNIATEGAEFVEHNSGADAYKDMLLMASCKHNIIANSTFSWWGAWLNHNPDKVVIAPKQWFRSNFLDKKEPVYPSRVYNTKDLIPETWTRL